jgi:PPP family 3-phenylpropionic acid transporter
MTCISIVFFVQAFQRFGFDKMTIGLIIMACNITSIIMQPTWGFLADRFHRQREFVICACSFGSILYFVMMYHSGILWVVVACAMGIYASFHCMMNLIDSWVAKLMVENGDINYGATRSVGSVTYAVTAAVFGFSVSSFGNIIAPYCFFALNLVLCAAAYRVPNPVHKSARRENPSLRETAGYLLSNVPFVLLVLACFLNTFCNSTTGTFYSVVMFELGGNEAYVGIGLFCMAIAEFPFMFFYKKIRSRVSLSNTGFLCIAMFFYFLKCFCIASSRSIFAVMLSGMFQGLSFGIYLPATTAYLVEFIDKRHMGSAQMLLTAMGQSLGAIIVSPISGALSSTWGTQPMMRLMSLFSLFGVALLMAGTVALRRAKSRAVDNSSIGREV